jgi:hypothetical protein
MKLVVHCFVSFGTQKAPGARASPSKRRTVSLVDLGRFAIRPDVSQSDHSDEDPIQSEEEKLEGKTESAECEAQQEEEPCGEGNGDGYKATGEGGSEEQEVEAKGREGGGDGVAIMTKEAALSQAEATLRKAQAAMAAREERLAAVRRLKELRAIAKRARAGGSREAWLRSERASGRTGKELPLQT